MFVKNGGVAWCYENVYVTEGAWLSVNGERRGVELAGNMKILTSYLLWGETEVLELDKLWVQNGPISAELFCLVEVLKMSSGGVDEVTM